MTSMPTNFKKQHWFSSVENKAFVVLQVYVGVPKDLGAGEKEREGIIRNQKSVLCNFLSQSAINFQSRDFSRAWNRLHISLCVVIGS